MYMFDKKGTCYPSQSLSTVNPFTDERYIKNDGNMIVLTVSHSADFGSIFRTARRSLNNSDQGSSLLKFRPESAGVSSCKKRKIFVRFCVFSYGDKLLS